MAIDLGDAIISVLVETAGANAQFEQFGATVPTKLAPAAAALGGTTTAVKEMSHEMAVGQQGAVELGTVMNLAGETSRESMYQARGEAGLLGEAFGIHLPRHVRSFIAEMPGVGVALSAAFQATAVLFIIDAIAQLIEKIVEFAKSGKEVEKAMEELHAAQDKTFHGLEDNVLRAQAKLAELTGNHLEALRLKLQLIDNSTLGKLESEFEKLGKEADKVFDKLDRNWFSKIFLGLEGSGDAKNKFEDIEKSIEKALNERTPESFRKAMDEVNTGLAEAGKELDKVNQQQAKYEATKNQAFAGRGTVRNVADPVDPNTIKSWETLIGQLQSYKKDIEEAQKAEEAEKKTAADQERTKELELQTQAAKRALEARLAGIEQEKAQQHAAFTEGKLDAEQWSLAQSKAANDAAKAQNDYKDKLADIARHGVDGSKAMAAAQDAATEKVKQNNKLLETASAALDKAQTETAKLRAEMDKLAFPAEKVHEQAQAYKELEAAEKKLAEAQKNLALAETGQDFKEQQAAIQRLTQLRLISKEQEAAMLARLDQREGQAEIDILKQTLAAEEKALETAKAKFQANAHDALFPPAELAQLKIKLDEAQTAWDKTQTEILRRQTANNTRLLAVDRSYYGSALTLAIATGNRLLAEKLKENHASLLAAQSQLAEAKARGVNTKSIEDQIKGLQRSEKELLKEASAIGSLHAQSAKLFSTRSNWDAYFASLTSGAMKTGEAFRELGAQVVSSFAESVEAALSGSQGFGEAMQQMLKSALAALTAHAIVKVAEELAFAASDLANPFMAWHAPFHFHAAGMWAAVGAGAAIGAVAIPSGGGAKSSSAPSGSALPAAGSPGVTAGQQPVSTVNVLHLASGGLVERPTLAVVGDAASGGRSREAVLPLDNVNALRAIAGAISAQMGKGGGEIHVVIHSDIPQLLKEVNKLTTSGRAQLTATNAHRVTRRS